MNDRGDRELTFLGASPIIFAQTIIYAILVFLVDRFYGPLFEIDVVPDEVSNSTAVALLCIGIPLYLVVLKGLKAAYERRELVTTGAFSVCRNPLFAVVILLLLPGLLLLFDSWLLLTVPCFMYAMFKLFIGREERLMEREFGQDYVAYKRNTPALFPKIWKYRR